MSRNRVIRILDQIPPLRDIMLSTDPVDQKRKLIRNLLTQRHMELSGFKPEQPSLKLLLSRESVSVFTNIISHRSERLTGFSLLSYLNDLIHSSGEKHADPPGSGFFVELDHLVKGIAGRADVYPYQPSTFSRHEGTRAAKLRSADLSRMARHVDHFGNRYPCGLDDSAKRRRFRNRSRILQFFDATDSEWNNWTWQIRNIVRDAETLSTLINLSEKEYRAVELAVQSRVPFGITPYYLSLMDYEPDQGNDTAIRAQVIPTLHYVHKLIEYRENDESSMDFMLERDTSPIEGITRRYPQIVILKPILTCPQICVYCQRNWEIEEAYSRTAVLPEARLKKALAWIADTPEIREVLITGGDPFLLSNERIENLLQRLSEMPHIERIRLGTRTPVTLPQRVTEALVKRINRFHIPGKREVIIITHFEHVYEITPDSMEAVQKFRRCGIDVYNQLVYTFYNSRRFEATVLRNKLRLVGVTPYYTFNTKGKEETNEYRVPIARLLQEQKEEARLVPGTVRTDEVVFNVPGLGKNYLRALQHHDVLSILPDGRRVYEFHPWEKKLALADTYIYTDVSIYDYMRRLRAAGENTADYRSIWFYY
ncbi:KamA family radical SAM protein [Gemmatimonadota bacterium]